MRHTFPNPNSFVSTTTRKKSARCRIIYAFTLCLMSLQKACTFPFSFCRDSFWIFLVCLLLPYPNIRIKRSCCESFARGWPCNRSDSLAVSCVYRGSMGEVNIAFIGLVIVQPYGFVCGARSDEGFCWIPGYMPCPFIMTFSWSK